MDFITEIDVKLFPVTLRIHFVLAMVIDLLRKCIAASKEL